MSEAAISNAKHEESAASDMKLATPWRRRWDSNPRAGSSPAKRFRVVPVMTTSIRLRIYSILVPQNQERTDRENKKLPSLQSPENKEFSRKFPKISNQFSSRARYDRFDTAPCRLQHAVLYHTFFEIASAFFKFIDFFGKSL